MATGSFARNPAAWQAPSPGGGGRCGRRGHAGSRLTARRALLAVLCALQVPVPCRADPATGTLPAGPPPAPSLGTSPSAPQTESPPATYDDLIARAIAEFERGNFPEARSLFEQAHALHPNARTLRGLGITAFELRQYTRAAAELTAALAEARSPLTPELREEANHVLARTREFVGTVVISVQPRDARVLLNGVEAQPRDLALDVGSYEVVISAAGYRDATLRISVEGGRRQVVEMRLTPLELSPKASGSYTSPNVAASDREHETASVLGQWWFWAGVAVVVAGGAATAGLLLSDDEVPREERGLGGVVEVLRVRP